MFLLFHRHSSIVKNTRKRQSAAARPIEASDKVLCVICAEHIVQIMICIRCHKEVHAQCSYPATHQVEDNEVYYFLCF